MANITTLDISGNNKIESNSLRKIGDHCLQLTSLSICVRDTVNATIRYIVKHCQQITHLNIADCQIDCYTLSIIVSNLDRITSLDISGAESLIIQDLADEVALCPTLTHLNISYCEQLSWDEVEEFSVRFRELAIVFDESNSNN